MTTELRENIREAARAVRERLGDRAPPRIGIILGTGLGQLGSEIEAPLEIPYPDVPHFASSTVESHAGSLTYGVLEGHPVLAMKGRFHHYEGYTPAQITFPVRVLKELGCEVLFVSNACGGMNPAYDTGDLVVIEDHINLMGFNPLTGVNDPELGTRFPDMMAPYNQSLAVMAHEIAIEEEIACHVGVYVAVQGPCLETRAEYRFLRGIGADTVGMSTVPEVIVAVQCDMRVLGISIVTDRCIPEELEPVEIEKIIAAAAEAEPRLTRLFRRVLARLKEEETENDVRGAEAGGGALG